MSFIKEFEMKGIIKSLVFVVVKEIPSEIQKIVSTLQLISTSLSIIAWIAVGIGWFAGWFKLALPIPSRRLKENARSEIETAGIAAFMIAIFSTLISVILWIIQKMGGIITASP